MADERAKHVTLSEESVRATVVEAVVHTHGRLNKNTSKVFETATYLRAVIELLGEKGLVTDEEVEERRQGVAAEVWQEFRQLGMGAMLQEPEFDKYTFESSVEIDCESRLHLCKAACCRLPFALSEQDVDEGVVRWELGQPYMIDRGEDGYCHHLERGACACTIYEQRPVPCRAFDCSVDRRIWADFDKRIPNPALDRPDWLEIMTEEAKAAGRPNGSDGNADG